MGNSKLCFIICHRYNKNYKSYIQYYIDNIQKFYKDSFVVVVDNNSSDLHVIEKQLENYKNVKIIVNNSKSKYEIGAYNEGIRYLKKNNIVLNFDYFIFSQDTFVLKNKFDVKKELIDKNIMACSFNHWKINDNHNLRHMLNHINQDINVINILKSLNVYDKINNYSICWCNSFILHKTKVDTYYGLLKDMVITKKSQSGDAERFLGGILYYLNNFNYVSLCGGASSNILSYDCQNVDIINSNVSNYFVKRSQYKP